MKATDLQSQLQAFKQANPLRKGPRCNACTLPAQILQLVRDDHAKGTPLTVLAGFVRTLGHQVSSFTMQNHFRDHEPRS